MKCFTDGMGSRCACGRGCPIDSLRALSNGDLAGRKIRNDLGNKKGRDFPWSAIKISPFGCLNGIDPAQAHADNHPNVFSLLGIDLERGIVHRHAGGRNAVLNEEIHFFDLF